MNVGCEGYLFSFPTYNLFHEIKKFGMYSFERKVHYCSHLSKFYSELKIIRN